MRYQSGSLRSGDGLSVWHLLDERNRALARASSRIAKYSPSERRTLTMSVLGGSSFCRSFAIAFEMSLLISIADRPMTSIGGRFKNEIVESCTCSTARMPGNSGQLLISPSIRMRSPSETVAAFDSFAETVRNMKTISRITISGCLTSEFSGSEKRRSFCASKRCDAFYCPLERLVRRRLRTLQRET